MKKTKLILLVSMVILTLSCKKNEAQVTKTKSQQVISEKVTADAFKTKVEQQEVQLIDVRTPEEYSEGYIQNALNINIYDNDFITQINKLDKNKPVYLYCKMGGRSAKAAERLEMAGFTKIYDLQGGFSSWQQKEYPISTKE
tara:strand:- start:87032 stop:87457 length:426 start_codon:yes stop_codon:yes gene_type:complete